MKEAETSPSSSAVVSPIPMTPFPFPTSAEEVQSVVFSEELYCELAARLLIMNVRWVCQANKSFSLPFCDRMVLLEESWKQLFIIGTAHMMPAIIGFKRTEETDIFYEAVKSVILAQLNQYELACIRAIILFQPSSRLSDHRAVSALYEHAQNVMKRVRILLFMNRLRKALLGTESLNIFFHFIRCFGINIF